MKLTEQTDFNPLFTGDTNTINTTIQRYGKETSLGDFLNISNISDATVRRYLMYQNSITLRKRNLYDPRKNFLSFLRMLGLVSVSNTSAYKVDYKVYERQKRFITGATVTTVSNSAIKIVLPADYSLASGIVVDINQILELGDKRIQFRVVGIDNGTGAGLRVLGVTDANVAMTAGAVGGTATANVLIAVPITTQTAPVITTTDKLFFVGNSREESSCPDNALMQMYPNVYESGFTTIDANIRNSGTAGATGRNTNYTCGIPTKNGGVSQIMVSELDYILEEEIQNRLISQILVGQKETNTSVLSSSHQTRGANGIVTSIAVNGGTIIQTTPGSVTFANTIDPIIDFCIQKGIEGGKIFLGSGLYKDLQSAAALVPSSWLNNVQVMPFSTTADGLKFNFTSNMIDWRGVKLELIPFSMFTDTNQWGIGYNDTGMFIPNKMTTVENVATGQEVVVPPIQVLFKKDQYGRVRDDSYETYDGGAGMPSTGACDYALKRRVADVTVVSPLASECILLQPRAATFFV